MHGLFMLSGALMTECCVLRTCRRTGRKAPGAPAHLPDGVALACGERLAAAGAYEQCGSAGNSEGLPCLQVLLMLICKLQQTPPTGANTRDDSQQGA